MAAATRRGRMSDHENLAVNVNGLSAHPARCSSHMPAVKGTCPACGHEGSLFLATGGWVTCANLACTAPMLASEAIA